MVLSVGDMLAQVLASLVIAYLLNGLVEKLGAAASDDLGVDPVHHGTIFTVIAILPRLSNQLTELIEQFPDMVARRFEAQTA